MLRRSIFALMLAIPLAAQTTLVKTNRILDVAAGRYLNNQGVLIQNGYIQQLGQYESVRAAAPRDATLLDLGSLTILPGLIDCHTHLLMGAPEKMNGADALILTIAKMSPMKRALLGAKMAKEDVDSGFTIVRNLGHSGIDGDIALRDAINSRWFSGPRILASGRKIVPEGGQAIPVQAGVLESILKEDFLTASNADEGRRDVLENLRVGVDIIKVVVDEGARILNLDTMKAIVEAAHRAGARVAAHATSEIGIQVAIDAGVDSIEHADVATVEQFQAMQKKSIYFVPTLWPKEMVTSWPNLVAVDAPARLLSINADEYFKQYIADQKSKMDRARKAGVKIVFGSDEWFDRPNKTRGEATLQLLAAMTQFGMTPTEAIRAATIDAASLLAVDKVAGSIEAKKFGDLVGIDGDPLQNADDLRRVKFVMKGGRVLRDERQR